MKMFAYVFAIILAITNITAAAEVGGLAESKCKAKVKEPTKCSLNYDLSNNPRSQYQLQVLDSELLKWRALADTQDGKGKFTIDAGALYRVLACDDIELALNCISSSATWAPSLIQLDKIPDSMEVTDVDGSKMDLQFVDDGHRYSVLSQYNVYLLLDIVNRATIAGDVDLPEMMPPFENRSTTVRSMDHKISHNTHSVYEGARLNKKN